MELNQHPLSAAFPGMTDEEFEQLTADIDANGQREPIIVHEGMVLDGWHRYRACAALGIDPKRFTFATDGDPVSFVLSQNLHRRHLSASQRAAAVVACSEWAPAGRPNPEPGSGFMRESDMAKVAGTSDRTIRQAKVAHKAGLTDMVKEGALTAKEAAEVARGPAKPKGKPPEPGSKKDAQLQAIKAVQARDAAQEFNTQVVDQLAETQEAVRVLAEENDRLNDRLAVEAMDASEEEKTAAAETIKELRERVRVLEIELDAVKVSRDTHMRESAQKESQIKYWRKIAEKSGAVVA